MCKIIYFDFHHLWIYIVLNERVFIIVADVIDTILLDKKQTQLNFDYEFMVP